MDLEFFLSDLTEDQLRGMAKAADEVDECVTSARKNGRNMVHEITDGGKGIRTKTNYPSKGVTDFDRGSHFYFHIHRDSTKEYGHFHTFSYPLEFNKSKIKKQRKLSASKSIREKKHAHLVAISVDKYAAPVNLFTTNRWVTKEVLYPEERVVELLDQFSFGEESTVTNLQRWTSALLILFRPQIIWLISQRDAKLEAWAEEHPESDVTEDKALEILVDIDVSWKEQQIAVNQLLEKYN